MKPLGWVGSAKEDLLAFPAAVVREMGHVRRDIEKVKERLKRAEEEYAEWRRRWR